MLWRWLSKAIRAVEGADVGSETFESAYFARYEPKLREAEELLGISAQQQATAYGTYQILGENLARYHGVRSGEAIERFLSDPALQESVARRQFYTMLATLIKRRGLAWPNYLFSMWNAGVNFNEGYDRAIRSALKGK